MSDFHYVGSRLVRVDRSGRADDNDGARLPAGRIHHRQSTDVARRRLKELDGGVNDDDDDKGRMAMGGKKQKKSTKTTTTTTKGERKEKPAFDSNPRPVREPPPERRERSHGDGGRSGAYGYGYGYGYAALNSRVVRDRRGGPLGGARHGAEPDSDELLHLLGLSRRDGPGGAVDPIPRVYAPEAVHVGKNMNDGHVSALDLLNDDDDDDDDDIDDAAGAAREHFPGAAAAAADDTASASSRYFEQVTGRMARGLHIREPTGRGYAPGTTTTVSAPVAVVTAAAAAVAGTQGVYHEQTVRGGGGGGERVTSSRNETQLARAMCDPKVVLCPHLTTTTTTTTNNKNNDDDDENDGDENGGGGGLRAAAPVRPTLLRTVHRGEGLAYACSLLCAVCEARLEEKRARAPQRCHRCGAATPGRVAVALTLGTGAAAVPVSMCRPCAGPRAVAAAARVNTYTMRTAAEARAGLGGGKGGGGEGGDGGGGGGGGGGFGGGTRDVAAARSDAYDAYDLLRDDWGGTPAKTEWDRHYTSPLRHSAAAIAGSGCEDDDDDDDDDEEAGGDIEGEENNRINAAGGGGGGETSARKRSTKTKKSTPNAAEDVQHGSGADGAGAGGDDVQAFSLETERLLRERKKQRMALLEAQLNFSKKMSARGRGGASATSTPLSSARAQDAGGYAPSTHLASSTSGPGSARAEKDQRGGRSGTSAGAGGNADVNRAAAAAAAADDRGKTSASVGKTSMFNDAEARLAQGATSDAELLANIDRLMSLSSASSAAAAAVEVQAEGAATFTHRVRQAWSAGDSSSATPWTPAFEPHSPRRRTRTAERENQQRQRPQEPEHFSHHHPHLPPHSTRPLSTSQGRHQLNRQTTAASSPGSLSARSPGGLPSPYVPMSPNMELSPSPMPPLKTVGVCHQPVSGGGAEGKYSYKCGGGGGGLHRHTVRGEASYYGGGGVHSAENALTRGHSDTDSESDADSAGLSPEEGCRRDNLDHLRT